jgi:drug/metabolite transporter (DMT)-like permease
MRLKLIAGLGLSLVALAMAPNLIRVAEEAPPAAMAFWRLLVGTAVFLPISLRKGGIGVLRSMPSRAPAFALLSGMLLSLHYVIWALAVERTTIGQAAFLLLIQPLMTAIAAHFLLKERLHVWNHLALGISLVGAWLISRADFLGEGLHMAGNLLALVAAFFNMAYLLGGRFARRDGRGGSLAILHYLPQLYFWAMLASLLAALVMGEQMTGYRTETWLALLGLGLIPTVIGHSLLNWAMRHTTALSVNMGVSLGPVVATIIAWFWLGEEPARGLMQGAPFLIAGAWLCGIRPPRSEGSS